VTDTGAGLSAQQLLEIGAEGVQFNANQLQAGQGSGLGLFISKGIVSQHGGTFQVTSGGLDCGATFSIELPLFSINSSSNYLDDDGGASSFMSGTTRTTAAPGMGGIAGIGGIEHMHMLVQQQQQQQRQQRLLVVDDAQSNRKLLLRILRTKNYICEEAEDGKQAVEVYAAAVERGEPFDAILCDFEMPVMNGPDAVRAIRALGCKCFIAGITGNIMQDDIDHFKARGADTVLYYYTTILLYYYTTILLYYYTTILLYYYTTILLYYYTTLLLYYNTTVPLYHCTTLPLYHYTTILLYYYTTILLYYDTTIPLYHYTTIPLTLYTYTPIH
jgi:CheY-like chemotaxis protein